MGDGQPVAVLAPLRGDLADRIRHPGHLIQLLLDDAKPDVIGRVPGGLHPPVAAHHRGRHRHRLQPDHQIPGPDPARMRPRT